ncbi:2Fe-2S iron-sulfur cluster-binding protein [Candidatus Chlorohelix sp.]|uniref:2Fe-2S iron-sulfur cluster-binding protein n=1 Tax=Candidatus Chlorohelix sp. TaxID=3139201 RepID=UPI003041D416
MPKVIINGKMYPAEVGETILEVARRNGAHIGFVCDGQGYCATCECKVLEGAELLDKPTRNEKTWLANRLDENYRLGCQTQIKEEGEIQVISRAEILRRQFIYSFAPPVGQSRLKNTQQLVGSLTEITTGLLKHAPSSVPGLIREVGPFRFAFPWRSVSGVLGDLVKVINNSGSGSKLSALPESRNTNVKIIVETVKPAELPTPVQVAPTPPPPAPVAKVEAPAPVQVAPTPPPPAPKFERDNLQKLEGIGPRISSVLNRSGIYTYKHLAETPVVVLQEILLAEGLKLNDPTSFPTQAKLALEGKWEELQALQDRLKGGQL